MAQPENGGAHATFDAAMLSAALIAGVTQAAAQITLYEDERSGAPISPPNGRSRISMASASTIGPRR